MPRPHEDLERHTPVDHRPGGPEIAFAADAWCAIAIAHVAADRVTAAIAAYETSIEQARTSSAKAHTSAMFRSVNNRRVISILALGGHDGFRHLQSAWDDHHFFAAGRAVAEAHSLALYRLTTTAGNVLIDPESKQAFAFERVAHKPERTRKITAAIGAAAGFRGVLVFGADDDTASVLVYHFERAEEIEAFRSSKPALDALGPAGAPGETFYPVHAVKTFA